jgi:hypothetical protein
MSAEPFALLFFGCISAEIAGSRERIARLSCPAIRIHSDRKWPERVVFDTSIPVVVAAKTAKADYCPAVGSGHRRLGKSARAGHCEMVPPEAKKPQRKRKIAKKRVAPPMIQVAQQPRFGFFNTW